MSNILAERKGPILYITLSRPERGNSLDPPMLIDLRKVLIDAQEDQRIFAICITGTGEKNFCTGIDTDAFKNLSLEGSANAIKLLADVSVLIYSGKPTIAAINGRTIGIAVVIAASADYRIAVDYATFQMPEVDIGMFPIAHSTFTMARICGVAWTRRLMMTGTPINVNEAMTARLVDEIVPKEKLTPRSRDISRAFGDKNPRLMSGVKFAMNYMLDLSCAQKVNLENDLANWAISLDSEQSLGDFGEKYECKYQLTGSPSMLLDEYEKNKGGGILYE
jgi:enoyl-CoA hydratase